jgi:hypothetical protein
MSANEINAALRSASDAYLVDLKSRLREIPNHKHNYFGVGHEAIDVIERLQSENASLRGKLDDIGEYGTQEINDSVRLRNENADIKAKYEAALKRANDYLEQGIVARCRAIRADMLLGEWLRIREISEVPESGVCAGTRQLERETNEHLKTL